MWQRTRGTRYRSGSRRISSSITDRNSNWPVSPPFPWRLRNLTLDKAPPGRLDPFLLGDSQRDAIEPVGEQTVVPNAPAFFTRTRKVVWNASSAACSSPNTRRQMPRTIGPVTMDQDPEGGITPLFTGQELESATEHQSSHRSPPTGRGCASPPLPPRKRDSPSSLLRD